ncbi:citrate-binding protein-like [Oryza glaberrima]|uniref:citrate-binding protein-like n=1 Tax=Oryza glaberrima TaxID=4538 RepID=UPI00224C5254|nr:citrate-binding protein-like [Oryza glaberrima]
MASSSSCAWCLVVLAVAMAAAAPSSPAAADPTDGFTAVRLGERNFQLQWPYDVKNSSRYSFDGTVRRLWVFSSDKPHTPRSKTKPRTEIRMTGYDYSSRVWQFEGTGYVPSGTTGVSIMQVFGGGKTATTLMLHVYDGDLWYYHQQVVEHNINDRWFRLNVLHDVAASQLTVFVDSRERLRVTGKGGDSHYFKFGVYTQVINPIRRMESRWRGVRILNKNHATSY